MQLLAWQSSIYRKAVPQHGATSRHGISLGWRQKWGVLDYVTCWYRRAAEYIIHTNVRVAEAEEDQTLDPTSRDNLLRRALHCSRTAS